MICFRPNIDGFVKIHNNFVQIFFDSKLRYISPINGRNIITIIVTKNQKKQNILWN
jgi:hypothetical protein